MLHELTQNVSEVFGQEILNWQTVWSSGCKISFLKNVALILVLGLVQARKMRDGRFCFDEGPLFLSFGSVCRDWLTEMVEGKREDWFSSTGKWEWIIRPYLRAKTAQFWINSKRPAIVLCRIQNHRAGCASTFCRMFIPFILYLWSVITFGTCMFRVSAGALIKSTVFRVFHQPF